LEHAFYASSFAYLYGPMIVIPLAVIWFVGRNNLLGKTIYGRWPGTWLFLAGAAILGSLTVASIALFAEALVAPRPAIVVTASAVTCRFDEGRLTLPWQFVAGLAERKEDVARRHATVHKHFAAFRLDPRYLDHLPWNWYTRYTQTALCQLDTLDARPDAIFRAIDDSWQAARG
jgi:hypothetical protein